MLFRSFLLTPATDPNAAPSTSVDPWGAIFDPTNNSIFNNLFPISSTIADPLATDPTQLDPTISTNPTDQSIIDLLFGITSPLTGGTTFTDFSGNTYTQGTDGNLYDSTGTVFMGDPGTLVSSDGTTYTPSTDGTSLIQNLLNSLTGKGTTPSGGTGQGVLSTIGGAISGAIGGQNTSDLMKILGLLAAYKSTQGANQFGQDALNRVISAGAAGDALQPRRTNTMFGKSQPQQSMISPSTNGIYAPMTLGLSRSI